MTNDWDAREQAPEITEPEGSVTEFDDDDLDDIAGGADVPSPDLPIY